MTGGTEPVHSGRKSDKTATQRSQFKVDCLLFTRTNFLYVKFPGESIAGGYIHRKNRYNARFAPILHIFLFFHGQIFCYKLESWMRSNKIKYSYVKKSGESIKIILIRRKNHYEPILPQISTNIWFLFNIALWFERRLSAANQKGVLLSKKVHESIKIILPRRKNHYEPVLPQISTNISFF